MKRTISIFVWVFILGAACFRILRHFGFVDLPPNVSPVAAMALFSGVYFRQRWAILVPIITMLTSDAIIGFYTPGIMASVYGTFLLTYGVGVWLRRHRTAFWTACGSLVSSTVFFVTTNAAVWLFGMFYSRTFHGLLQSYIAGIPFFRNTILGDLGFTAFFFGSYALAYRLIQVRQYPREGIERI